MKQYFFSLLGILLLFGGCSFGEKGPSSTNERQPGISSNSIPEEDEDEDLQITWGKEEQEYYSSYSRITDPPIQPQSSSAKEYGIFSLSEEPKIDTTISDTTEITVDFTEQAKKQLTGSGTIPITIYTKGFLKKIPEKLYIKYNGSNTEPATLKISLNKQEIIDAGVQNEKYITTHFDLDTRRSDLPTYYSYIDLLIHKEEYNTLEKGLAEIGVTMTNKLLTFLDYNVPNDFIADFREKTHMTGINTSFAHQFDLGLNYQEESGYCPTEECTNYLEIYTQQNYGYGSYEEYKALKDAYKQEESIRDFTFSLGSQVPVEFFLKHVSKFEGKNSGEQDYSISHLYNKQQGKQLLEKEGFDKKAIMKKLRKEYGVKDFSSVLPKVLLNIAQTISDPQSTNSKPLAIYVRTSKLSEGTFSDKRLLASLAQSHNIILAQVKNNRELKNTLRNIKEKFPQVDLLVLSSHGSPSGMEFIDAKDIPNFDLIATILKPEATIFLSSCSTAEKKFGQKYAPFAYVLSKYVPGRTVIAAKDLTKGQYLRYNPSAQDSSRKYTAFMWGTPIAIIKNGVEQEFIK
jgi:hypothetical protein